MQRAQIRSCVRELRSHVPHHAAPAPPPIFLGDKSNDLRVPITTTKKGPFVCRTLMEGQVTDRTVIAAAAKSRQSCPTLCDPKDGSPPGSPVPGILQARTLEWAAISFSSAWKWKVKVKSLSRVWLFATPWTAAYQAPPSMGFSRQEYWSGVPLPSAESLLARFIK